MSMDSLRDKIRANKNDTQELNPPASLFETPESAAPENPAGTSDLPSTAELSESILANSQADVSFDSIKDKTEEPQTNEKKLFKLPLMDKLDKLEINKKMLGVSLAIAGFASLLSWYYMNSIAEPYEKVQVVVVTQNVPANTKITNKMIALKNIPKAYVYKGALVYKKGMRISGQMALTKLYSGEMLNQNRISWKTGLDIPDGHRAIPIRTSYAYQMKPMDFVDVIASVPDPHPKHRGQIISVPVLQKARILAVGKQVSTDVNYKNYNPKEITLAVPNAKVNLMNLLDQKGNLKVVLRAKSDDSVLKEPFSAAEIEAALQGTFKSDPEPIAVAPKPTAPPKVAKDPEIKVTDEDVKKLVDLSAPRRATYRAPVRRAVRRAPVRRAVKRAPVRKAAPVRRAPVRKVRRAPVVINGGVITQGGKK